MSQGILQNSVLCIDSDGQVILETAYANGNCEFLAYDGIPEERESTRAFVFVDVCGTCVDVGFSTDVLFLRSPEQGHDVKYLQSSLALPLFPSVQFSQFIHKINSSHTLVCNNTPLHSLRSVILLI